MKSWMVMLLCSVALAPLSAQGCSPQIAPSNVICQPSQMVRCNDCAKTGACATVVCQGWQQCAADGTAFVGSCMSCAPASVNCLDLQTCCTQAAFPKSEAMNCAAAVTAGNGDDCYSILGQYLSENYCSDTPNPVTDGGNGSCAKLAACCTSVSLSLMQQSACVTVSAEGDVSACAESMAPYCKGSSPSDAGHDAGRDAGRDGQAPAHDAMSDSPRDTSGFDATGDGVASDGPAPPMCTSGALAIVGGAKSLALGATSQNGAAWSYTSLGSTMGAPPSLVAFSGGFVAAFGTSESSPRLQSTVFSSAWSLAAQVGSAQVLGTPALAATADDVHVVYRSTDEFLYHGIFGDDVDGGNRWDSASDPLQSSEASIQSSSAGSPAAAWDGSVLLAGFDGKFDNGLYTQGWSGTWSTVSAIQGAGVLMVEPTALALSGGPSDMLLVYEDNSGQNVIQYAVRTNGSWGAPAPIDIVATTTNAVSATPTTTGGAIVVYEGTDSLPYFSIYEATASPAWTSPAPIDPRHRPLPSPPSVAPGVCGADATAALVESDGVEIFTLLHGAWSGPVVVPGTTGVSYAAIAVRP